MRPLLLPLLALSIACTPTRGAGSDTACGIAAVAGPSLVLSEFGTPGAPLASAPVALPARLVTRFVAGPASPAVVGRRSDSLEIGVEGGVPADAHPGFGVLITDRHNAVLGVLVYDGTPILGAPLLGNVTVGPVRVPLIGVTLDPARVQDPRCPFFPDTVLQ
jgi:hypothetical protein